MRSSSVYFSTTGMMRRPIFLSEHCQLDELGVLEPVTDDGGVVIGQRCDRNQLGLRSGLEPEVEGPAEIQYLLDDLPLLVHFNGIDADVFPRVFVLGNSGLKGVMNVLQPMLKDVAKPNQRRKADPTKLEMIDQLLQIDRPVRFFRGMDFDVTVVANGEVSLPPAGNLVHLGGIDRGPGFPDVVGGASGDR